ncbi:MAG: hypothetical protein NWE94_08230 [Candidatus Bathyarchaeota archaeon]|nr:hypothetical protein [Candidatus Bathyarchaeota archaeon]
MRKTRIAVCLLLFLLSFAAGASMLDVKSASALKVSVQWGHLAPSGAPAGEGDAESWICDQIYWNFYNAGTWAPSNAYWQYTQLWCVVQVLQYCQSPNNGVNWATTWWVGDFKPTGGSPQPFGHLGFYGHNGQDIFDSDVYKYANYYYWSSPYYNWWQPIPSKQYFDFVWTCTNGDLYWYDSNGNYYSVNGITQAAASPTYPPPSNPNTKYGFIDDPYSTPPSAVGLPLAWTGAAGMSADGYSSPDYGSYCYVGWEAVSPFMVNPTGYNSKQYMHFPYYFYRYALGIDNYGVHANIHDSLDYATRNIFGSGYSFGTSILTTGNWSQAPLMWGRWYSRMRVFGNSNLNLPY